MLPSAPPPEREHPCNRIDRERRSSPLPCGCCRAARASGNLLHGDGDPPTVERGEGGEHAGVQVDVGAGAGAPVHERHLDGPPAGGDGDRPPAPVAQGSAKGRARRGVLAGRGVAGRAGRDARQAVPGGGAGGCGPRRPWSARLSDATSSPATASAAVCRTVGCRRETPRSSPKGPATAG